MRILGQWPVVPLKRLTTSILDGTHGTHERVTEGVPLLSAKNIVGGSVVVDEAESRIRREDYELINRTRYLQRGDVLLTIVGTIGRSAIFDLDYPVAFQRSVASLRPDVDTDRRYLRYVLESSFIQDALAQQRKQTAQGGIYLGALASLPIPKPPLEVQSRIADFLDRETARIDDLMRSKRDMVRTLKSRRRALVDDLIGQQAQRIIRVKNAVRSITSGPRGWSEYFSETGRVFLRITNVSADSIDLVLDDIVRVKPPTTPEAGRTRADAGDVVVSITAEIGAVGVVREDLAGCHISQHLALLRTDQGVAEPDWLALCLFGSNAQAQLDSARYGGTKTQLSLDDVTEVRLPLPSLDSQRALLAEWRAKEAITYAVMQKLGNQLKLLREHRQALISTAVTDQTESTGEPA